MGALAKIFRENGLFKTFCSFPRGSMCRKYDRTSTDRYGVVFVCVLFIFTIFSDAIFLVALFAAR